MTNHQPENPGTEEAVPSAASVEGPSGPRTVSVATSVRPDSLIQNTLPVWFLPACAVFALVVGFLLAHGGSAFDVLTGTEQDGEELGVNWGQFVAYTALVYLITAYVITRVRLNKRRAVDGLWRNLVYIAFLIALTPLISVVWSVTSVGSQGLMNSGFFTSDMAGVTGSTDEATRDTDQGVLGGIRHAIVGSLMITIMATVISVPIGLLTSIYLVEYARGGPLSRAITFFVDVMTGIPSIVAGLFGAAAMTTFLSLGAALGLWSATRATMGITAAIALCVLMIPVVVRTTEEMLRIVPNELREASYALGVRKWLTIMKVVIPTSISGIAAGVTLAIARVIGETAPILLTAGFATRANWDLFDGWMTTLPVFIYQQFTRPLHPTYHDPSFQRAWGAALVLIIIVMLLNLVARLIAAFFAPKTSGK